MLRPGYPLINGYLIRHIISVDHGCPYDEGIFFEIA